MNKFSKNTSLILSCVAINSITSIFIYTYLLAYIIDISNNSVTNVAKFYLTLHIAMIAFSWIMAPLFKKFKKTLSLKFGVVAKFLFVGMIVVFKDSVLELVYLIAIFNAFAEVVFWGGMNPLQAEISKTNNLRLFISISKVINIVINVVVPIIMGYFIDQSGLSVIAIAMMFCVVGQIVLSIFIKEEVPAVSKLKYREFLKTAKANNVKIKSVYINQFLYGICSNMSMLILYYTVVTFGSNLSIGIFSSVATILSVLVLAFYNWKKRAFSNIAIFIVYSVLFALSIFFIILELNKISLIAFYLVWNVAVIVPEIITSTDRLSVIKHEGLGDYNIENITISETYLDGGRVVGEVLILVMSILNSSIFNIIGLSFIGVVVCLYFINSGLINRNKK